MWMIPDDQLPHQAGFMEERRICDKNWVPSHLHLVCEFTGTHHLVYLSAQQLLDGKKTRPPAVAEPRCRLSTIYIRLGVDDSTRHETGLLIITKRSGRCRLGSKKCWIFPSLYHVSFQLFHYRQQHMQGNWRKEWLQKMPIRSISVLALKCYNVIFFNLK